MGKVHSIYYISFRMKSNRGGWGQIETHTDNCVRMRDKYRRERGQNIIDIEQKNREKEIVRRKGKIKMKE